MSDQKLPVTVAVTRPDGSVDQVRVGWAVKQASGFSLQLGELTIGGPSAYGSEPPPPRRAASAGGAPSNMVFPNYGRSKGAPVAGASVGDLEYYASGARRSLADPSKSRFHDKERQLLAAIEAELARRGAGGGDADSDGPPPRGDDDGPPPYGDPF